MTIDLYGVGVIPNSTFNSWTNITVTSDEEKTNISFSWEDFTPADESIEIDGYNVYFSDDGPLPKTNFLLADYLKMEINENSINTRVFSEEFPISSGSKLYINKAKVSRTIN